jgi:hypothetical protein
MRPPEAADSPLCVTPAIGRRWVIALPDCRIGATRRFHFFLHPSHPANTAREPISQQLLGPTISPFPSRVEGQRTVRTTAAAMRGRRAP